MAKATFFMETKRLWLRPFTQEDLHSFVAMRSDPTVARYQSWSDFSQADGYVFILDMQESKPDTPGEWYQFAVALRHTNTFIGDCALFTSEDGRSGEIGYTFAPAYQGQGYATEAVTAVLNYALNDHNMAQITAIADNRNAASIKLLQRLGFQYASHETVWFKGEDVQENHYTLTQEQWRAQQ
jgi:RimJ/RimL family protein N-acetyltransferase